MKIGVLGTGTVGKTVSHDLSALGYDVIMGTRDPGKQELVAWRDENAPTIELASFADAASAGELLILAVNWESFSQALELIAQGDLEGKTVLDLTNPMDVSHGEPQLAIGFDDSAAEVAQRALPKAHVVKALNTVTAPQMVNPQFSEGTADVFIAGNDEAAKKQATTFLENIGWRVVDTGDITKARLIEPFAMLWINHYFRTKSLSHGFSMLRN